MRKILIVAVCSLFLLGACDKDEKFNRYLDGTWITTSINGVPVTMADALNQYQFSKSNKYGGTVKVTHFYDNKLYNEYTGTYKISDKGKTTTIDATETSNSNAGSNPIAIGSTIHMVHVISNKEDKKFTVNETSNARKGFVGTEVLVLEMQ